ncbi:hypothetical protein [Schlesneria paludicola]|uniref:hypothetical protein n=1 Tax=Schlesneria paludicola TaxID=360056 RepID=UPI00029B25AA|nr:hypothetical protein [Schlesneria paludicola]
MSDRSSRDEAEQRPRPAVYSHYDQHREFARCLTASAAALAICGLLLVGCNRTHYRTQADEVVSDAVAGATANPRFALPGHSVAVDSRSRLYDPTDPDFPPMPPDDPDSARLMVCVDGHRGWPHWHKDGDLDDVEVNDYRSYLPFDENGKVPVNLESAVELSRLHSRDYQAQLETLYLAALDVSAERFAFQSQFYGGNSTQYVGLGSLFNGGTPSSSLTTASYLRVNKMLTTGTTLMVGALNSVVWQFSGGQTTVNSSLLNFAVSQPLLQYAGRPYILERLTRVERNLLWNVRQYERYRQGFYLQVVTGASSATGLQRIGGLFGGSGLNNFSGVGSGGFGGIGAITTLTSGSSAGNAGIAPGIAGGYLGFLQTQQIIRNVRARNSRLRETWLQLRTAYEAGRLENRYQVDLAQQAYYSGQSFLLNTLMSYQSQLDSYKIAQMGLPPDVPIEVKGNFFEQFNLVDPDLQELLDEVDDRLEVLSTAQIEGTPHSRESTVKNLGPRIREFLAEVTNDLKLVDENLPKRKQMLLSLAEFPELKENHFDIRALTPEALDQRVSTLRGDYGRLTDDLTQLAQRADAVPAESEGESEDQLQAEKEMLNQMSSALLELSLLQARARLHGVSIHPVNVTSETAFQIALAQRADWMNAKAGVVDGWRLIRYNANALRSNVTINVSGNLRTTGNNPVNFAATESDLAAGVTFDAPLTRVIERNKFRQSLIDYQQTRRSAMAYRDSIHYALRDRMRQIRVDQLNVEIRRLAVDTAITQSDVAYLKLVEPERPAVDGKTAPASPTLARDLVDALQNLLDMQQAFLFVWGHYEVQRRLLDFDMGTMQLDERGLWIDPGPMTNESLIDRYYNNCPDAFRIDEQSSQSGYVELHPGDLPPEPSEQDLNLLEDLPKPQL